MKSYEVKQISTILSHFYNLEKLKDICFYCIENNIFQITAAEPLRSCFCLKCAVFTASMGKCYVICYFTIH